MERKRRPPFSVRDPLKIKNQSLFSMGGSGDLVHGVRDNQVNNALSKRVPTKVLPKHTKGKCITFDVSCLAHGIARVEDVQSAITQNPPLPTGEMVHMYLDQWIAKFEKPNARPKLLIPCFDGKTPSSKDNHEKETRRQYKERQQKKIDDINKMDYYENQHKDILKLQCTITARHQELTYQIIQYFKQRNLVCCSKIWSHGDTTLDTTELKIPQHVLQQLNVTSIRGMIEVKEEVEKRMEAATNQIGLTTQKKNALNKKLKKWLSHVCTNYIPCVVVGSPSEADAMMVQLCKQGLAEVVITEDTDLLFLLRMNDLNHVPVLTNMLTRTTSSSKYRLVMPNKFASDWLNTLTPDELALAWSVLGNDHISAVRGGRKVQKTVIELLLNTIKTKTVLQSLQHVLETKTLQWPKKYDTIVHFQGNLKVDPVVDKKQSSRQWCEAAMNTVLINKHHLVFELSDANGSTSSESVLAALVDGTFHVKLSPLLPYPPELLANQKDFLKNVFQGTATYNEIQLKSYVTMKCDICTGRPFAPHPFPNVGGVNVPHGSVINIAINKLHMISEKNKKIYLRTHKFKIYDNISTKSLNFLVDKVFCGWRKESVYTQAEWVARNQREEPTRMVVSGAPPVNADDPDQQFAEVLRIADTLDYTPTHLFNEVTIGTELKLRIFKQIQGGHVGIIPGCDNNGIKFKGIEVQYIASEDDGEDNIMLTTTVTASQRSAEHRVRAVFGADSKRLILPPKSFCFCEVGCYCCSHLMALVFSLYALKLFVSKLKEQDENLSFLDLAKKIKKFVPEKVRTLPSVIPFEYLLDTTLQENNNLKKCAKLMADIEKSLAEEDNGVGLDLSDTDVDLHQKVMAFVDEKLQNEDASEDIKLNYSSFNTEDIKEATKSKVEEGMFSDEKQYQVDCQHETLRCMYSLGLYPHNSVIAEYIIQTTPQRRQRMQQYKETLMSDD